MNSIRQFRNFDIPTLQCYLKRHACVQFDKFDNAVCDQLAATVRQLTRLNWVSCYLPRNQEMAILGNHLPETIGA